MEIVLIRHAKPLVKSRSWVAYKGAMEYLKEYESAGIEDLQHKLHDYEITHIKKVFCSKLTRSKSTARAIFGPITEIIESDLFNEFTFKIIPAPFLIFPLKFWVVFSRILYLIGIHFNVTENFNKARKRSKSATKFLERIAEDDGIAVLVAHGFLNYFIRRYLKKNGWNTIRKDGQGYLGLTIMEKKS